MDKTVDEYLKLPYTIELIPDSDGGFAVTVKDYLAVSARAIRLKKRWR